MHSNYNHQYQIICRLPLYLMEHIKTEHWASFNAANTSGILPTKLKVYPPEGEYEVAFISVAINTN